jgi:hypothetical protein
MSAGCNSVSPFYPAGAQQGNLKQNPIFEMAYRSFEVLLSIIISTFSPYMELNSTYGN